MSTNTKNIMVCGEHVLVVLSVAVVAISAANYRREPRHALVSSFNSIMPTRELCEELYPPAYRYPQKTRSPFTVSVAWDVVPDIRIYVDSPYSLSFEGLVVQMRSERTRKPIGVINGDGSEAHVRAITCSSVEDTGYMATKRWRFKEVVYWLQPEGFNRSEHPLTLHATVVLGPYVFWHHEVPVPLGSEDPYVYNEPKVEGPVKKKKKFDKSFRPWDDKAYRPAGYET